MTKYKYDIVLAYPKPSNDSPVKLTPLSILFPGTLFEKNGLKVAYYDERFDSEDMLIELIKNSKEIGVSAFTGYQAGQAIAILEKAKAINPAIITGVGGHHARILPEQVLAEPAVDKVWAERSYGDDLFPYNERTKIHFERTDMQYFTSRGCPFSCAFCAISSEWIPKNIKDVEKELTIIHDDIKFEKISFSDPNIAYGLDKPGPQSSNKDRVKRINQIGKIMRKLNVKWDGNMRCTYVTPEMVDALIGSQCYSLELGCESGNDFFLKNRIKKGHGVDAIKMAVNNIKNSGVSVMYSFVANMPGETKEMRSDTMALIDWIIATDSNARVSVYSYAPYPGSRFYEEAITGAQCYPKFSPPTSMKGWSEMRLMIAPIYWIAGLCFRLDNSRKNFQGDDWRLIEPYVKLAQEKWKSRNVDEFPCEEVEKLIQQQLRKNQ